MRSCVVGSVGNEGSVKGNSDGRMMKTPGARLRVEICRVRKGSESFRDVGRVKERSLSVSGDI